MKLELYTTEELRKELKARERLLKEVPKQLPVSKIDLSTVLNVLKAGVQDMTRNNYENDDFKHYVFEALVDAVYGKHVYFRWRNKQAF